MSESLDLSAGKAGVWYTVGNILLKGCLFLTLPIFTRLLSTADFGTYNTYMAYEAIMTAVLGLGLYGTVKNAKLDFKDRFEEYLSSVISMSLIFFVIVVVLINVFYDLYEEWIGFSRLVINCLVFQSFGMYLIHFYGAKLNIEFKYKSYIAMSCFNTLGNILISVLLILFVFPNERYLGRILGSAIPLIMLAFVIVALIIYNGKRIYSKEYWKYACMIGLPLIPHVISQSLLSHFDRIMITNMVGESESGIFSYIFTICTIISVLSASIDNAWTPWMYMKRYANENKSVKRAANTYVQFFALLCLGFMCVMPELTKIIADREYWSGTDLLIPLTMSNFFVFLYFLPVGIEYYHKQTKYISFGTVSAALLNCILNYFAIRYFGYKSAAYTTVFSHIVMFAFHWLVAEKFGVNDVYSLKNITGIACMLGLVSLFLLATQKFIVFNFSCRYVLILLILFLFWKKRYLFLDLLSKKDIDKTN